MLCVIIFIFVLDFTTCDHLSINGTIDYDTNFFYMRFGTPPSKSASFEYYVTFPFQTEYVNLFFYTTETHVNMENNCSLRTYNQVMHNSMHQEFRTNHKACPDSYNNVHCHQSRRIHHYEPRNFSFSFGFYCTGKLNKSLKGLQYNVIIDHQSNTTVCTNMSKDLTYCSNYYRQVSFPNLIDHSTKEDAAKLFHTLIPNDFILDDAFDCYPYFLKAVCYLFFPKCIGSNKSFIVPCNETFEELSEACLSGQQFATNPENVLSDLLSSKRQTPVIFNLLSLYLSNTTFDFKYLPPVNGSIPCYYEKVKCESPPKCDWNNY